MYLKSSDVINNCYWKSKLSVKFTNFTLYKNGMFLMLMKLDFYNIPHGSFWSIMELTNPNSNFFSAIHKWLNHPTWFMGLNNAQ